MNGTMNRRVLQVEGAYNVRDLGGYRTKDGRKTRFGAIYRADGLHRLTPTGQRVIEDLGVRTVIDLRHGRELLENKSVFEGSGNVAYRIVSLLNPVSPYTRQMDSLGDVYIGLLEDCQPELRRVFAMLAESERGDEAVLFHCAVGKDRTGVVAALLLELAGVERESIIEDYTLTAMCIAPLLEQLRRGRPPMVPEDEYEKLLGCEPSNMREMLRHLEQNYGNAEQYLLAIGLRPGQVQAVKERLLER